ncbi:MFS transporter [Ottowia testudinis]|uniref:MFS transporter n=1 Tax=Ottowia testudinis TaxID=2816950 RepID=A0A975H380_9BURK|nr:MFS transporter [Ottowia testudinis]QTD45559.1 MFS transporter [Ottowia testudinis]
MPSPPALPPTAPLLTSRQAWAMLLALASAFTLSQAFRTLAAIMGPPLATQLALTPQQLGLWAAAFHFAFGVMQLAMGVSLDLYGVRRTILLAFPMAIIGALLSSQASSYAGLMLGQMLIGTGCAPAFLVCTVFIGHHFSAQRFTSVSGLIMSLSSIGVLATATPLAWLIEASSWRWGFGVLAGCALLAWGAIWWLVREPAAATAESPGADRPSALGALRGLLGLFKLPQTLGLVAYAAVAYAGFITLRGLWLGPLLVERHGFSLIQSGNVALAMTLASMASPALFGRLDPGGARRVRWLLGFAVLAALMVGAVGLVRMVWVDVALAIGYGLLSGYGVLQYGYVRDAYPQAMRGRALSLFTMAMFLGISLMQWASGLAASLAPRADVEPFTAALLTMSALLLLGALAFWKLPRAVAPA